MKRWSVGAVIFVLLSAAAPAFAQEASPDARNSAWYLELLGNGGLYSVNYERRVRPNQVLRFGAAAWTSEDLFSDSETRIYSFPITTSYLAGSPKHKFEIGGGLLLGHQKNEFGKKGFFRALTGIIGYRYEADSGFLFRTGLTPFYGLTKGDAAYPEEGAAASIGMSFGFRH